MTVVPMINPLDRARAPFVRTADHSPLLVHLLIKLPLHALEALDADLRTSSRRFRFDLLLQTSQVLLISNTRRVLVLRLDLDLNTATSLSSLSRRIGTKIVGLVLAVHLLGTATVLALFDSASGGFLWRFGGFGRALGWTSGVGAVDRGDFEELLLGLT